jgi:hypothetical protein
MMANRNDMTAGNMPTHRGNGLYRSLIALRIHHDRMVWARVQLLIAVQGAVIAGSYAVGDHRLAGVFLLAGAALSLVIYELVTKDQLDRDANSNIIDVLGELLVPAEAEKRLQERRCPHLNVRMSANPPKWRPFVRGKYLIPVVIWTFIVFDLSLSLLHFGRHAPVL